jgi:hypothetical protein
MTNKDLISQYVDTGLQLPEYQVNKLSNNDKKTYARKRLIAHDALRGRNILSNYEVDLLTDEQLAGYLTKVNKKQLNQLLASNPNRVYPILKKQFPDRFGEKYESFKTLINKAKDGDEESLDLFKSYIPTEVGVEFFNEYIVFIFNDNRVYKKCDDNTQRIIDLTSYNSWVGNDSSYFYDLTDNEVKEQVDYTIDRLISKNQDIKTKFNSIGIELTQESLTDLLESYDKYDEFKELINEYETSARDNAKDERFDEIKDEIKNICYYIERDEELYVKITPFINYASMNGTITDDYDKFIDNIVHLLENILDEYGAYNDYDDIWSSIEDAGYGNGPSDDMYDRLEGIVDDAISDFELDDSESNDGDEESKNVFKLRSQLNAKLNAMLKKIGEDPNSEVIENDITKIKIDRKKINLSDDSIYLEITDKRNNNDYSGYVPIDKLVSYFINYKLFEEIKSIKRFM